MYLLWDMEPSPEPVRWYKCRTFSHSGDGLSTVIYPNHWTETIDIACINRNWQEPTHHAVSLPRSPHHMLHFQESGKKWRNPRHYQPSPIVQKPSLMIYQSYHPPNQIINPSSTPSNNNAQPLTLYWSLPSAYPSASPGKPPFPDQCFNLEDKLTANLWSSWVESLVTVHYKQEKQLLRSWEMKLLPWWSESTSATSEESMRCRFTNTILHQHLISFCVWAASLQGR